MKLTATIVILFLTLFGYSQNKSLSGFIYNSNTGDPIQEANISVIDDIHGTTTNTNGFFKLTIPNNKSKLLVTHIQYYSLTIDTDTLGKSVKILLTPSVTELPEATVHPVIKVSKGMLLDVIDYCFVNENLLLAGYCYRYKRKKNPWLVLLSPKGDTLFAEHINKEGRFFHDCFNNIHYVTEETAYQLIFENDSIYLGYPSPTPEFKQVMLPCQLQSNNQLLFSMYAYNDQMLLYYLADMETEEIEEFRTITNEVTLTMLAFQNHFFSMGGSAPSEADLRFEREMMYDSVFAPVVLVHDTIALINYLDEKIEWYDTCFNKLGSTGILFQKNRFCKEELIRDPITEKIYAVFLRNGKTKIQPIDISTGKTGSSISIPDFKWIDNIQAYNGNLYFLYRQQSSNELRALYRMKLSNN